LISVQRRQVDDITVLDLRGRITLGEGSRVLRESIRDLLDGGKNRIILNLSDISYIDSSGFGELVAAFTAIRNQAGKLVLENLTQKVSDQLQVTKLFTVFEVYDTESNALSAFRPRRLAHCPVCSYISTPPLLNNESVWAPQSCRSPGCRAQFTLESCASSDSLGVVKNVRIETYTNEYLEILSGNPITVGVFGRLDHFASSAFRRLGRALSKHRKVLFDLGETTEVDVGGRDALLSFITNATHEFQAVVSLEGLIEQNLEVFAGSINCYLKRRDALEALGDGSIATTWTTTISTDFK
jgi:anti-sigma B factor antagonist